MSVKSFKDRPESFEEMGATTKCAKMLRLMGYTTGSLIQKIREDSISHHFKEDEDKYKIRAEVYTDKDEDYLMTQSVVLRIDFVAPYINVDANAKKDEFLKSIERARLWTVGCDMAIFEAIEEVIAKPKVYDELDSLVLDSEILAYSIQEALSGPEKDEFYVIRTMFKTWEEGIKANVDVPDVLKRRYLRLESKREGYENLSKALSDLTSPGKIKKFLDWVQKSLVRST